MNKTNKGPCDFFSLLAPPTFQTCLFSGGWGKLPVPNPARRYHCPVSLFSDSLCNATPLPFQTSILKGQACFESKCECRNTLFVRLCIARQSAVNRFPKKFFLLLCGTIFTLLLLYFLQNFFPCPCLLIYHHALSQGKLIGKLRFRIYF